MKYSDIKYYINLYTTHNYGKIKQIRLSKMLFWNIAEDVCCSYFEIYDEFTYDNFTFKLEKDLKYKNYMVIDICDRNVGLGYDVLSENERIIKELLE